jgi:dolichyl-phosphate beta-glucosyltransferase
MANLRKGVLDKIASFFQRKQYTYEVVIVDDGSEDGSVEFVEKFSKQHKEFRIIKNPHYGKAGAVTTGILQAKGEYRLFTDMDQATPIEEIDNLLPYLEKGKYDIAIGSRESSTEYPWSRHIMHEGMIAFRKLIVGITDMHDTQCGFKVFKSHVAEKVFGELNTIHHGFKTISRSAVTAGFDVELLYIARQMDYKIKEVPVSWLFVESRRVSPLGDSLDAVRDLVRIRINSVKGVYKVHE